MERIAEALQEYEQLTARLRAELANDREDPGEAVSRVLDVADRTKAELISEGEAEAEDIRRRARVDVEDMVQTAWVEAKRIRSDAESEATTMVRALQERQEQTDREIEERLLNAEHAVATAQMTAARIEDEWAAAAGDRAAEAASAAERTVAAAHASAEGLVASAERERSAILARAATVRAAYEATEVQLRELAAVTLRELEAVSVVDLTDEESSLIDLTAQGHIEPIPGPIDPGVVELASRREADFADPDGSGRPPADRPLIDPEDVAGDDDTETFSERRTSGLRSRIDRHSAAQ